MITKLLLTCSGLILSSAIFAQSASEKATSQYLDSIKSNTQKLTVFLKDMPKGGDLHTHHTGASMAENMLSYAKGEGYCINKLTWTIESGASCSNDNLLDEVVKDVDSYNAIINAWSMRHFQSNKETGADHFFAAFGKYSLLGKKYTAEMLSEILQRAGEQNEMYIELMLTPDNSASSLLGKTVGWDNDFAKMREKLLQAGIKNIVKDISNKLDMDEAKSNALLQCGKQQAQRGCNITLRYLYQIKREQAPEQVFSQLLAGFEAATSDARVVGINMVQREDGPISMRDYDLQMQMIGFLHELYPSVSITLHAGELTPNLVPGQGLGVHIGKAVKMAHAKRIGHGVDIAYEQHAEQLLNEMAKKQILVEINLSSNAAILNVKGKDHPFMLYMQHNVPLALSTDDEAVLRTNLTEQYVLAISQYNLTYPVVKNLVRNSIAYGFLRGESLWYDNDYTRIHASCEKDMINATTLSSACQSFLQANEKAQLQWKLEKQFSEFEKTYH